VWLGLQSLGTRSQEAQESSLPAARWGPSLGQGRGGLGKVRSSVYGRSSRRRVWVEGVSREEADKPRVDGAWRVWGVKFTS
jgi:hypothetical protein